MQTDEKRKTGGSCILAGVALCVVLIFELGYIVSSSLPDGALFSRFSPELSAEDEAMLQQNVPGSPPVKELKIPVPVEEEPATAVDAALAKRAEVMPAGPAIVTDAEGIPSSIAGAGEVQWSVVNTNELKDLAHAIAATNALREAAVTNALRAAAATNAVPTMVMPDAPEKSEKADEEIVPVG